MNKKISLFIAPSLAISFLVNCSSPQYDVSCEIDKITLSKTKATKGKDFCCEIIVNSDLTNKNLILPDKLSDVTSGDKVILDYTYTLSDNKKKANLEIPGNSIIGNINISLTLVEPKPWYTFANWWDHCSTGVDGERATTNDIGKEFIVKVNDTNHRIRLTDIDHDDLANDSGKAHCTFEFENLLSDSEGYSLATVWNWENGDDSTNDDYLNSTLRKSLDGEGNGTIAWYEKEKTTKSKTYTKPVLNMLPDDLQKVIKEVKKPISTTSSYTLTTCNAKVFPLSYAEITEFPDDNVKQEGLIYKFYAGEDRDTDNNRIKYEPKFREGAVQDCVDITDGKCEGVHNFAGFNSLVDNYGGHSWLRSPFVSGFNNLAYRVGDAGYTNCAFIYGYAFAVAPAFCI